jgi:broad specificity polyphosphatase/5'/3'-nucleotidase SurE
MPPDADVAAHRDGYATITPIGYDLTAHALTDEIKAFGLER